MMDKAHSESNAAPHADGAPPIRLDRVTFSYGDETVLEGCSLTVEAGESVILTGENGAGKSTLLRVALGELSPSSGAAELFGRDAARFTRWRNVGYVPQRTGGAYDRFPATVVEVVAANRYALGRRNGRDARRAALAALETVHLSDHASALIGELSGGQLQRALLARALVNDPELLILDEPTSGLDAASVDEFIETLAAVSHEGGHSVLMVTHDLERLEALDAHRFVLAQGAVQHV